MGELTIAGQTKTVELDASLVNIPGSDGFVAEGKEDLRMEDYKEKAPFTLIRNA